MDCRYETRNVALCHLLHYLCVIKLKLQHDIVNRSHCMAVCPKHNNLYKYIYIMSVLFKFHAISFNVRFQHRPQHFAHFCNSESAERFSLRKQEEQRQTYFEYVVSVHEMFVLLIGTLPALPSPQKDVTSSKIGTSWKTFCCYLRRPTHRPGNLPSLARTKSSESGW